MSCRFIVLVFCLVVAVSGKIGKKIIGGRTTDITLVPYQVSLQFNDYHLCGGAIIQLSWILTAAHCLRWGPAQNYSVRAGSNKHFFDGELVQVEKVFQHHLFQMATITYDVALLKLKTPLPMSKKIKTIPISKKEPKRGDQLLVSGWGLFQEEVYSFSENLQSAIIPVISRSKCNSTYIYSRPVTDSMICAGFTKGGKGSCKGDSGGPVVFNNKLVGVVSWGKGCARPKAPAVFANVVFVKPWIDQILEMNNNF